MERIHRLSTGAAGPGGELLCSCFSRQLRIIAHYAHLQLFDLLHLDEVQMGVKLHCHNVWYAHQLPWPAEEALSDQSCIFSVVQSSTGVSPGALFRQYVSNSAASC